jgi:hypothetical protein
MRVIELHAPVKLVQRSKGRSAVAAAAYRAGERLTDERTGLVHDYRRKQGIEGQTLILPDNAPDYAHDREKLWNAAEQIEKHPRAQTARDMTVAFPSEFSLEQRAEAGHRIGQWLMFRYGSAVDVALHEPSRKQDQQAPYLNFHAHLLFTTRRWDEKGEWAKTKDRTLDDLQKGPEEIKSLRQAVADVMNNIAARDRLPIFIEHLSYADRGLDREATQHLGPTAAEIERRGQVSDIGSKNRQIQARNEQRAQLENESNVVDIETAREKFFQKGKPAPYLPPTQYAAYSAFYRETQSRRAAMLEELDRQHRQRERELQQQSAQLNQSITGRNLFGRVWNFFSGRTREEKEQLAEVTANLERIRQHKEEALASFERDRRTRMETLRQQRQQEQEEARAILYPMAVGSEHSPAPMIGDEKPSHKLTYEERRDIFFARTRHRASSREEEPGENRRSSAHRLEIARQAQAANPLNSASTPSRQRQDADTRSMSLEARQAAFSESSSDAGSDADGDGDGGSDFTPTMD